MSNAHGCGCAAEPTFILPDKIYDFIAAESDTANYCIVCCSGQYIKNTVQI